MSESEHNSDEQRDDESSAERHERETEEAKEEIKALEEDPPQKLEDWPAGKAKYQTFGGPETETGYDDAATAKLGPADLEHHEDGSVSIGGEKVDNPDEYKGEPIPGGPTDPDAPDDLGTTKTPRDDDKPSAGDEDGDEDEKDDEKDDGEKDD